MYIVWCVSMIMQVIKNGSLRKLKDSLLVMKRYASSLPYPGVDNYLDICYLQSVEITHNNPINYYMTLLAHAAVQKRKEMVKYLLEIGASKSFK